jgi:hypothetical protein
MIELRKIENVSVAMVRNIILILVTGY